MANKEMVRFGRYVVDPARVIGWKTAPNGQTIVEVYLEGLPADFKPGPAELGAFKQWADRSTEIRQGGASSAPPPLTTGGAAEADPD